MNIYTTPNALQAASAKFFQVIRFVSKIKDVTVRGISCTGDITTATTYDGELDIETYNDLDETTLYMRYDANAMVYITGNVTSFICDNAELTMLDISKNTALTYLDISGNSTLTTIVCTAGNKDVANGITYAIKNATSTTGTVTVYAPLTYASIIQEAATAKGWTYKTA